MMSAKRSDTRGPPSTLIPCAHDSTAGGSGWPWPQHARCQTAPSASGSTHRSLPSVVNTAQDEQGREAQRELLRTESYAPLLGKDRPDHQQYHLALHPPRCLTPGSLLDLFGQGLVLLSLQESCFQDPAKKQQLWIYPAAWVACLAASHR